jgi:hypothetical protein
VPQSQNSDHRPDAKRSGGMDLDRNNRNATMDWRFTTENARIKLKRLYPKL